MEWQLGTTFDLVHIGDVLRVYVSWTPGSGGANVYYAEVQNGAGYLLERADDIHFRVIARDIGVAMAHRILREAIATIEGVSLPASVKTESN